MALGLDKFQSYFDGHQDKYVLIGGAACHLLFDEAGLQFRATKDLDIVLIIELIDADFLEVFWRFIHDGQYEIRERSDGAPQLFRFVKPKAPDFPFMVELFSRRPEELEIGDADAIARLIVGGDEASLSAILLDDDYYGLLKTRRNVAGISLIGPELLIPFKARAFLDLSNRKAVGEQIDSRRIEKHKRDIVSLSQLLAPSERHALPAAIQSDLGAFLESFVSDERFDPNSIGVAITRQDVADLLSSIYRLESPA